MSKSSFECVGEKLSTEPATKYQITHMDFNETLFKSMMVQKFLLVSLLFPICTAIDIITNNKSLTGTNILLSKEGVFALGFFSPGSSRHKYLGIWYHKLPGKTVVWVANRENPINDFSGFLSINPDGNLVLYASGDQKFPIWSTNVSLKGTVACTAQLLGSGNLVLIQNESQRIVWQSFDYPTDTMLPGMKIGMDWKVGLNWFLTSWRSANDPEIGDSSFKLNPAGSPQFFLYKDLTPYWRSNPWPWRRVVPPPIPEYLYKYAFVSTQDEVYYTFAVEDKSLMTRSVVDNSGLIQRLTWDPTSGQWKPTWSAPKYIYGHCGAYSICNANNVDAFECTCLPGYKPKSSTAWYLRDGTAGCVRKRQLTPSLCRNGEGFVKVAGVKVPDTSIAALRNDNSSSTECKQLCLKNCSCKAFASLIIDDRKGFSCLTWYGELMDAMEHSEGYDMYVRVDATELANTARNRRGFLKKKGILVLSVLVVALAMFIIIISSVLWKMKKKRKVKKNWTKGFFPALVANEIVESTPNLPIFDLQTISAATNNFSPVNKLGHGGFGSVFKGQLLDGQEIAVKRLSRSSEQGVAEFKNEVVLIARLQHRNLVKLLGCCIQRNEQMLIYEYLPHKSLDYFIFDSQRRSILDWRKRFDIVVGIARGILYLHHDSRLRIIHRDLKPSNILLDHEMNPKISDFGMARILEGNDVQDKTRRVVGTFGYMAPEYITFGKCSTKSDIYSFGVILFEIISGKKSNTSYEDPSLTLIGHVWDLWREGRALDIVDPLLMESSLPHEVFRCIQIALLCVQEDAAARPSMPTVVLMLNGETALPCPKQPAFIFRRTSNDPTASTPGSGNCSINKVTITQVQPR